jgi:wyosine [tRNA(Phe)-imidazoG37] synthetase (radical SAM superfamily)
MQMSRSNFYDPKDIFLETQSKINDLNTKGEKVDYITFVADGEPTLDINLGTEIELLRQFGIKIAVITNASLIWMDDVKRDLMKADWVSIKIDAANQDDWYKVDRPHGNLRIERIIKGTLDFAESYKGTLVTETMLVSGFNDNKKCLYEVGVQLAKIKPAKAYILVPTRPPAESNVKRPSASKLKMAFSAVRTLANVEVECITEDEGESFFFADDIVNELLSILSVHPVREEVIDKLLKERKINKKLITDLVQKELIKEFIYENKKFFRKNQDK